MDWAESEWKDGLTGQARLKVGQLEEQLGKFQKMYQQKQLQNDQLEQAFNNLKKKLEEEKTGRVQQAKDMQSLCEQFEDLRSRYEKVQHELQLKDNQMGCLEGQFVTNKALNASTQNIANQMEELQLENKALRSQLSRMEQSQRVSLSADTSLTDKITTPARGRHGQKSGDEVDRMRNANDVLNNQVKDLEQKLKNISKELECQRHNYEAARTSLETKYKQKETSYQEDIRQQAQANAQLSKTVEETKAKLQQEISKALSLDSLRAQLEKETANLQNAEKDVREQHQLLQEKDRQLTELENTVAEGKKALQHSDKCLANHQARADSVEAKFSSLEKEHKCLESEVNKLRTELCRASTFEEKCKSLTEKLSTIEHTLSEKESICKSLQLQNNNSKATAEQQLSLINELKQQNSDLSTDIGAKEKLLQDGAEDSNRLNKLIADQKQATKALEDKIQEFKTTCHDKDTKISQFLSDIEAKDSAIAKAQKELADSVNALQLQLKEKESAVQASERSYAELKSSKQVLEDQMSSLSLQFQELKVALGNSEDRLRDSGKQIEKCVQDLKSKEGELTRMAASAAEFETKYQSSATEVVSLAGLLKSSEELVAELKKSLVVSEEARIKYDAQVKEREALVSNAKDELLEVKGSESALKTQLHDLEVKFVDVETKNRELLASMKTKEKVEAELREKEAALENTLKQLSDCKESEDALRAELDGLKLTVPGYEERINKLVGDLQRWEVKVQEKQGALDECEKALEKLKDSESSLKNSLSEMEAKVTGSESTIRDLNTLLDELSQDKVEKECLREVNQDLGQKIVELEASSRKLVEESELRERTHLQEVEHVKRDLTTKAAKELENFQVLLQKQIQDQESLMGQYNEKIQLLEDKCSRYTQHVDGIYVNQMRVITEKMKLPEFYENARAVIEAQIDKEKSAVMYAAFEDLVCALSACVEKERAAVKDYLEEFKVLKEEKCELVAKVEKEMASNRILSETLQSKNENIGFLEKDLDLRNLDLSQLRVNNQSLSETLLSKDENIGLLERDLESLKLQLSQLQDVHSQEKHDFEFQVREVLASKNVLDVELENKMVLILELQKSIKEKEEQIQNIEALKSQISEMETERQIYIEQISNLNEDAIASREKMSTIEKSAEAEKDTILSQLVSVNQKLSEQALEINNLFCHRQDLEKQLENKQQQLSKLEEDLKNSASESTKEAESLKAKLDSLAGELETTYESNTKLLTDLQAKETTASALQQTLEKAELKLVDNFNLLNNIHNSVAGLHAVLFPEESFSEDSFSPDFFMSMLERLRMEVVSRESSLRSLERDAMETKRTERELSSMCLLDSLIYRLDAVKGSMGEQKNRIDRITVEGDSTTDVEIDTNQPSTPNDKPDELTNDQQLATQLEGFLDYVIQSIKRLPVSRLTPLDELNQARLEIESLNQANQDLKFNFEKSKESNQDLENKIDKIVHKILAIIAKPDGERNYEVSDLLQELDCKISMLVKEIQNKSESISSLQQTVEEVEGYLQSTFDEKNTLQKEVEELKLSLSMESKESVAQLEQSVTKLQSEIMQQALQISELNKQCQVLESEKCDLEKVLAEASSASRRLEENSKTMNDENQQLKETVARIDSALAEQLKRADAAAEDAASARNECSQLSRELSNVAGEASQKLTEVKRLQELLDLHERQAKELESEILELVEFKRENVSLKQKVVSLEQSIKELENLEEQAKELKLGIEDLRQQLVVVNNDKNVLQTSYKEKVSQCTQFEDENVDLKERLNVVEKELESLANAEKSALCLNEENQALQSKISELNDKLRELENINMLLNDLKDQLDEAHEKIGMLETVERELRESRERVVQLEAQVKLSGDGMSADAENLAKKEIEDLRKEHSILHCELLQTKNKVKCVELQRFEALKKVSDFETQNEYLKAQLMQAQDQHQKSLLHVKELEDEVKCLDSRNEQAQSKMATFEVESEHLKTKLGERNSELAESNSERAKLEKELENVQTKLQLMLEEAKEKDLEIQECNNKLAKVQQDLASSEQGKLILSQQLDEHRDFMEGLKADHVTLSQQREEIDELKQNIALFEDRCLAVQARYTELESQFEAYKEKGSGSEQGETELKEEIENLKERCHSQDSDIREKISAIANLESMLVSVNGLVKEKQQLVENISSEREHIRETLEKQKLLENELKSKLCDLENQLSQVSVEHRTVSEEFVRQTQELRDLKCESEGRLEKLKALQDSVDSLEHENMILKTEKDLVYKSKQDLENQNLQLEEKLKCLQVEFESTSIAYEERLVSMSTECAAKLEKLQEALQRLPSMECKIKESDLEIGGLKEMLEGKHRIEESLEARVRELEGEVSRMENSLKAEVLNAQELSEKVKSLEEVVEKTDKEKEEIRGQQETTVKCLQSTIDNSRRDLESAKGKIHLLNRQLSARDKLLTSVQENLLKADTVKEALVEESKAHEEALGSCRGRIKELEKSLKEMEKKYQKLWEQHGQLSSKVMEYESSKKALEEELQEKRNPDRTLNRSVLPAIPSTRGQEVVKRTHRLVATPEEPIGLGTDLASNLMKTPPSPVSRTDLPSARRGILTRVERMDYPTASTTRSTRRRSRSANVEVTDLKQEPCFQPAPILSSVLKKPRLSDEPKENDIAPSHYLSTVVPSNPVKSTAASLGSNRYPTRSTMTSSSTGVRSTVEASSGASKKPLTFSLESNSTTSGAGRQSGRLSHRNKKNPGECTQQ